MTCFQLLACGILVASVSGCAGTGGLQTSQTAAGQCRETAGKHGQRLRICETDQKLTIEDVGPATLAAQTPADLPRPPQLLDDPAALVAALPELPQRRFPLPQPYLALAGGKLGDDDRIVIALTVRQLAELLSMR